MSEILQNGLKIIFSYRYIIVKMKDFFCKYFCNTVVKTPRKMSRYILQLKNCRLIKSEGCLKYNLNEIRARKYFPTWRSKIGSEIIFVKKLI